jgi:uncharacterized protein (TIGR03067 family)
MNDAAALVGAWRLVTVIQSGRDVTALCDPVVVYRVEGSQLLVQSREGGVIGACHLPSAEGGNCIDMTYVWKGTELVTRGIYRCEGDDLIVCFGGSQRPDSFDGTVSDGRIVYTYRRIAAAAPTSEKENGGRNASTQTG